jgi:ubiquinone/menaquinone biosynthesis C-methylase UbiE
MDPTRNKPQAPPEVIAFYDRTPEESRLENGVFRLEFARTQEILTRVLPAPPARIADVGGGAGAYSFWLADRGDQVHLIDASPRLIEHARRRDATRDRHISTIATGDARQLPFADGALDAVLLMGPLYHLPEREDRRRALSEARRVLAPGGVVAAAAISRFASALSGLTLRLAGDCRFVRMRDRDLVDGRHMNDTDVLEYFTTAYMHRPDDLRAELEAGGFGSIEMLGVEGPGWMLPDFDAHWEDPTLRHGLVDVARALEAETSIQGASAHLLAIGRRG